MTITPERVVMPLFKVSPQPEIPLTIIKERRFDLIDRARGDHMLDRHDERTITANVDEVLAALRTNLEEHREIVAEAKVGYVQKCKEALEKAQKALAKRLAKLAEGEQVEMKPVVFNHLHAPEDHSKEFLTVIKMLELHKAAHESDPKNGHTAGSEDYETPATITLKALDVQRFVLNDWSWMDAFLVSNSLYSSKAKALYDSSM